MFKRFMFQIVMLLVMAGSVWAADPTLDLGTGSAAVGTTVTIPMTLTTNGTSVSGLSMDIGYDTTALGNPTATLSSTLTSAGFTLGQSAASGVFTIGIFKVGTLTPISDGVVANVTFTVSKSGTTILTNTPGADFDANAVNITGANGSVTGLGLGQTITFPAAAGLTFGTPGNVSATASSGLTVSFNSTTPAFCTVAGTTVTPVAAGTCTVAANQAGNSTFNAAPQVTQNITVAPATQSISFGAAPVLSFGGGTGTVSATATSALPVSFSSTTTGVCTVSGTTVTAVAGGTCIIAGSQAGNGNFLAAPQVTQSFSVAQAGQTITFPVAAGLTFGTPGSVSATSTSGLTVSFSSTTPAVCSVSGTTVTPVTAGTCTVAANQAGNGNFLAATPVTQNITVAPANQSISFGVAPTLIFNGATGSVTATATSALAVSFSTNTPGVCTVAGSTVTPVAAGSCVILANQAGNTNFNAAPQATQTIPVGLANQTISFGAAPALIFGGAAGTLSATASSALAVSFSSNSPAVCTVSGNAVTPVAAGSCVIFANQAGNTNFNAAPQATQTIPVALASQSISFGAAPALTFGGGTGTVSATATSALTVSFSSTTTGICTVSGTTVTPVAGGTCIIAASQAGNANFLAAPGITQSFSVAKAGQTITFPVPAGLTFGSTGSVSASSTSNLTVSFSSSTTGVCTVSGTTVTPVAAGTCTIAANQAGNGNFLAATPVTQNITIAPANQSISFGAIPSLTFHGANGLLSATASSALAVTFSSNTPAVCTVSGSTVTPVTAGSCVIFANQAGNGNFNAAPQATQTIPVALANQTISFGAVPALTFGGGNGALSATATSALAVTFSSNTPAVCTVSGSTVTPVTAGSCVVFANQAGNGNFNAAPQATQTIPVALASQSVSFGAAPTLTFGGGTGTVSATATSALAVSFSSTTTGICTVSGNVVTPVAGGICTIAANQAGNGNFLAAPQVTLSFSVAQAGQTITFPVAAGLTFGTPGSVSATSTSGLTVAFSSITPAVCTVAGTAVTPVTVGTCTIAANQAGNGNFLAAPQVTQNINVAIARPGAPTSVTAVAGNTLATVSFSAPLFTGGSPITSYTITSNPAGGVDSSLGSATNHVITGLSNGTQYTFTVTASNLAGAGAISLPSNPVIPVTVPDAPTSVTAVASPESASVSFIPGFDGGHTVTSFTVTSNPGGITASGSSSPIAVVGLTDATAYTFTVTATSSIGTSPASLASNSVTPFSAIKPVLVVSALADGSFTNNPTLNVSGTVTSANGIASLTVNGNPVVVGADSKFSTPVHLIDGANNVDVVATDGSTSSLQTTNSRVVNLDRTVPVINSLSPADGIITNSSNVTVSGNVSETATVSIALGGGTPFTVSGTTTFSHSVGPLVEGINTISVSATDLAGNSTLPSSYKITVHLDNVAPALAVTSPAQDIQLHPSTNTAPLTVTGTVTDDTSIVVKLAFNGTDFPQTVTSGQFTQVITVPSVEGIYPVVVTATDAAGNISTVTRNVIFTGSAGDATGNGGMTAMADVVKAAQYIFTQAPLTPAEKLRLDCAPLGANGQPDPNGVIDSADVILLLRRIVGLVVWQ